MRAVDGTVTVTLIGVERLVTGPYLIYQGFGGQNGENLTSQQSVWTAACRWRPVSPFVWSSRGGLL